MITNFKVIGLTRLEIKRKFAAPEADAFTTKPSALLGVDQTGPVLLIFYCRQGLDPQISLEKVKIKETFTLQFCGLKV